MFHNETEPPLLESDGIPYSNYNPRILQDKFDGQGLEKIDLIIGRNPNDLWTWNIGLQKRESELDRAFIEAALPKFDCHNPELTLYKIPKDLDKTFTAQIVFGNEKVTPEEPKPKPSYYNRPKEIACLFVAYVESFRLNPDFWTAETMDGILASAEKLMKRSITVNYKADDMDFDIVNQLADKQAVVGLKVHFTGPLRNEPSIYRTMSLYFSKYNAAVLCSKNLFLLIWKRCQNSFYVFDPNGRNELCQRNFETGKCSLMATRTVEHLMHLILNFSQADVESKFNFYEIFLINYGKVTNPLQSKPFVKRTRKLWAVVNDTFAIIPAVNNGLQPPTTGSARNASMVNSLLALLYAHIEPASTWRPEIVDDLIKYGQQYFKSFVRVKNLKKNQHLYITDLPDMLMMGVLRAALSTRPFMYAGHVADCNNYLDSQLTLAMRELFSSKWETALLQIDNSVMAIWRDKDYFYLFDPFRRGKAGQILDPEDFLTKAVACLQIHTTFESLCRVLYQKALKMRRGGKFFLHGLNVGCIKPIASEVGVKNRYTRLQLTYPKYTEEEESEVVGDKKDKKSQRGQGKKGKLARQYSIHTIPDEDRIPEFEDKDVVQSVLDDIICEIFTNMIEPRPDRTQLYKQAENVLLRSDKAHLETLKYNAVHGHDPDNICSLFQIYPDPPPKVVLLEEELLLQSNYKTLPDGAWVIFGTSELPVVDETLGKMCALVGNLITAALTQKYKISTWNSELIEYALASTNSFLQEFPSYEHILSSLFSKTLPKVRIGQTIYELKVQQVVKSARTRSLRQVVLESLINFNRLIVICQRFSCLIVKRYNFLYMFIAFPCTPVGYRQYVPGPGCMLRFIELDSLIRRIEFGCNPQGCEITNYVATAIKVVEVTKEPPERWKKWPEADEEAMYDTELEKQNKITQNNLDKIRFLDDELRKENERIQKFLTLKRSRTQSRMEKRKGKIAKAHAPAHVQAMGYDSEEGWEAEYEMEGEEEGGDGGEEEVELKHIAGKRMKRELFDRFKPRPILYGYKMRERDCLFKIQGSTALQGRDESSLSEIKACFFTSTLAILYAIMRPLNEWSAQRIDRVIENGKAIASNVSNMTSAFERVIKKVIVDDYEFDLWVKTFEPAGVSGDSISRIITKATQKRHYLLFQMPNCTFAIYRDEYFHLFDPYGSMELTKQDEEEEEEGLLENIETSEKDEKDKKKKCPKSVKRYGERNTASWILFADAEALMKYINERDTHRQWANNKEYQFHVIDILSYKKAAPKQRILQLLTDLSVPMECTVTQHGDDESAICVENETASWLDLENCLPVWSRFYRRNTAGRYRNLPLTKLKKFDVEIPGRLWSLWGNLHPHAPVFETESRGKQYLACNVLACCAARIYRITDWSSQLLDTIVISGDRYHRESLANIKQKDYEFSLEDLNQECILDNIKFVVHLEHVAYGKLYCVPTYTKMNLAEALMYFFGHFQFGVLQCHKRSLAIGRSLSHDGGYFMYDCQSRDYPLFPKGQGASYLLRTKHLQVLLYCIVVTLNISYFNVQFTLHKVVLMREGALVEESVEEGEGEEEERN